MCVYVFVYSARAALRMSVSRSLLRGLHKIRQIQCVRVHVYVIIRVLSSRSAQNERLKKSFAGTPQNQASSWNFVRQAFTENAGL